MDTDVNNYFPLAGGEVPPSSSSMKKLSSLPRGQNKLFEIDEHFQMFRSHKRECSRKGLPKYYQVHPDFPVEALSDVNKFLVSYLTSEFPEYFTKKENGSVHCSLTGSRLWVDQMSPKFLFHALSLQVPEDLIVFSDKVEVVHLMSPAGWSAEWAVGKSFSELHDKVLDSSGRHVVRSPDKMVEALRRLREPSVRIGAVAFYPRFALDRHPDTRVRGDTWSFNNDQQVYLRFERQTITPIDGTGTFLFTIHPYYNNLLLPSRIDDAIDALKNIHPDAYWRDFLSTHGEQLLSFLEQYKANPADSRR